MDLLRNVSIFESASDDLLKEIADSLTSEHITQGDLICRQGVQGKKLYLIRSGQVRVTIESRDGEEELLRFLGPGDCFGEMSLITGEPVSASVTATIPTELFSLEAEEFDRFCEDNPTLYREIAKTLAHRLRETNFKRVISRLGKVTRFIAESPNPQSSRMLGALCNIAESLFDAGGQRILLFVPLSPEKFDDEDFLKEAGLFGSPDCSGYPTGKSGQPDTTGVYAWLASLASDPAKRWFSSPCGFDCLLWRWDADETAPYQAPKVEEAIIRLKPIYHHIFTSCLDWSLEQLLIPMLPDEQVTIIVDLLDPSSQRPAKRKEYNQWIPEGVRHPPTPGENYWVLTDSSLDRFSAIARNVSECFECDQHIRIVAAHSVERPLLDYSAIRRIFPNLSTVHALPICLDPEFKAESGGKEKSIALRIGRNPSLARGRVARDLGGIRIGLALGGGGARGLAHIGVIQALEEEGIPIDILAGSSMGSVVAAAYGVGRNADTLVEDMRHHWANLGNFFLDILDYNLPRTSLLRGRKIKRMIKNAMAQNTIPECHIPVFVVCTDLITGKEVVLEEGYLGNAIHASGSLPGIFSPVRWGEYLLVDGAVLNKVPARVLKQKGADVVLAVNVTPERALDLMTDNHEGEKSGGSLLSKLPGLKEQMSGPSIFRIISRSLSISGLHQSRIHSDNIDVEIKPRIEHFDFLRFDQFDEIVHEGAESARRALPEIRKVLDRGI